MLPLQMEARSRNLGFGFPGYDGCFPKATRSSRGRGDHTSRKPIKASELPKEMCFFELLATVAGQLLQEQNEEAITARSQVDPEATKANVGSIHESTTPYGITAHHTKESETTLLRNCGTIIGSRDLKCTTHKVEASYEPSAVSCVDMSDPTIPQEQESKPMKQAVKAPLSRKKRNSGTWSSQPPSSRASIEGYTRTDSRVRLSPSKSQMDIPRDLPTLCSGDSKETNTPCTQGGHVDLSVASRQCQGIDLLMHAPFQNDVESPLLVSSGSSEEMPFPMERKSYSTTAFESSTQGGGREEFSCWKADDDDDDDDENSSESIIAKNLHTKSSSLSYIRAVKARRGANSSAKKKTSTMGYKRKRHEMEDGMKCQKDAVNCSKKVRSGRKKVSKLPSLKDDMEQPNFSPCGTLVDSEHKAKAPIKVEKDMISSHPSSPINSGPTDAEESNVKLSIKSFMVPELMVDLPESATVANLKKAVMEAAMNLLGGGLCVRVLLQGQKVVDESESLLQAGIFNGGKSESLGFMLEPHPVPASTNIEDTFLVLSHTANQAPPRYPVISKGSEVNAASFHAGASEGMLEIDANSSGTEMQSTTVSPSKEDILTHDSNLSGSCALVLHSSQPKNGSIGLAVVPFSHTQGNLAINKRRIRRPFSVAEVEVLVQAVEKLGTGRWRDVKLHAFPQAKHRTYVDLKDKWKTLVHTASIAPHQRRGEPVPQILLDRVIQAHSYWTAQQAKQQSIETKVF